MTIKDRLANARVEDRLFADIPKYKKLFLKWQAYSVCLFYRAFRRS